MSNGGSRRIVGIVTVLAISANRRSYVILRGRLGRHRRRVGRDYVAAEEQNGIVFTTNRAI